MLQSILFQILKQEPRTFPLFRERYLQRRRRGSGTSVPWDFADFETIFRSITEHKGFRLRIELFLDAVDESEHSSWVMESLRQQLIGRAESDITIKAIVARRQMEVLHDIPFEQIIQLEDHNAIDIEKLINEGVGKIRTAMRNFTDEVDFIQYHCKDFQNKLEQRASGVILWVSIALTTVLNVSVRCNFTPGSMMKTLDALPSDLEELYAHIVCRLEKQSEEEIEMAKHRLHWATHPRRTLTVEEFFHAIASSECLYAQHLQLEDAVIHHVYVEAVRTTLSSSCGGFLEVQGPKSESGLINSDAFLVQIIHRSVRTLLAKKKAGPFQVVKQECNLKIIRACIQYLRLSLVHHLDMQEVAFMQHLGRHPLLVYIWAELPSYLRDLDQKDLVKIFGELTSLLPELRSIDLSHPGLLILHTWTFRVLAQMPPKQAIIELWKAKTKSDMTESNDYKLMLLTFLRNIVVAAIEANNLPAFRIICGAGALECDEDDQIRSVILVMAAKKNHAAFLESIDDCWTATDATSSKALRHAFTKGLEVACENGYEAVTRWFLGKRGNSRN